MQYLSKLGSKNLPELLDFCYDERPPEKTLTGVKLRGTHA